MSVFDFLEPGAPGDETAAYEQHRAPAAGGGQPSRYTSPPLESFLEGGSADGSRGADESRRGERSGVRSTGARRRGRKGGRDFQKENVRLLKEKQRLNRLNQEREAAEAARAQQFKMRRFQNVPSKVAVMRSRKGGNRSGPAARPFLKAGTGGQRAAAQAESAAAVREAVDEETAEEMAAAEAAAAAARSSARAKVRQPRKAAVPRERGKLAPRENRDYVAANARAAMERSKRRGGRATRGGDDPTARPDFGKVPEYLIKRKIEAAKREIEAAANAPDPDCPPGMMRMPEGERVDTLAMLEDNRADILQQLNTMPLRCDTFGLRRRKHALEQQLQEAEDAIKVFSRDKVFIRLEDAAELAQ